MCQNYGIKISGIIINILDPNGYQIHTLKRDIEELTNIPVFGSVPYMDNFDIEKLSETIINNVSFNSLFKLKN